MNPPFTALGGNGPDLADNGCALAEAVVDQAIYWFVLQSSGHISAADQRALHAWRESHPDHARAWARLERMGERLHDRSTLAPDVVRGTLARVQSPNRRRMLGHLLWAAATGTLLWTGRHEIHDLAIPADLRTAAGERSSVTLADGTLLRLNTATAVDVRYDRSARRILLRGGEIELVTAPDPAGRPLWVESRDARLVPVGTRFSVQQQAGDTRLGVREGAVDVHLSGGGPPIRIAAGGQALFKGSRLTAQAPLDDALHAWTKGILVAANRSLGDLLADLARYRTGYLHCSPEVAELRVTGTWPLDGTDATDAVLASLERRLPVRIQHLTRYWVRVLPRNEA